MMTITIALMEFYLDSYLAQKTVNAPILMKFGADTNLIMLNIMALLILL